MALPHSNSPAAVALAALAALGAFAGCDRSPVAAPPSLDVEGPTTVLPVDHPPLEEPGPLGPSSAHVRRLTVPQVQASFAAVLGTDVNGNPVNWMVGSTTSGFDRYGGALASADFLNITEDGVEPSTLYAKFMGDAARDACNRTLAADAVRTELAERVMTRFVERTDTVAKNPDGIDQNLRYLKLRFHGVKLPDDDTARIEALRTLFDTVVQKASGGSANPSANHVRVGWHAVCVALLTDPEFHLY